MWAVKWMSRNELNGYTEHFVTTRTGGRPPELSGCRIALFRTRKMARAWRDEYYGYIRRRPDLQKEPHGWMIPKVVKVAMKVYELDLR